MYNPISDYGLIGDTHSTALIDRDGSVDWLCWPRHDSPALFLRLLDQEKGGACRIALDGKVARSRRYLPGTNILETRFETTTGVAVLIDLMPVNPPATVPDEGPDGENESRLIRMLTCESGTISGSFTTRPTFDYARAVAAVSDEPGGVLFVSGWQQMRAYSTLPAQIEGDTARMAFRLEAGAQAVLVLTHGDAERRSIRTVDHAAARLVQTRAYWEGWSSRCRYQGPYRDAVLRSVLCLKLLTYSPSGGIVAAPTTSLPEAVPGNRNYDYRLTWLRDASFTVTSFARLGYTREAAEFLRFLRNADPTHGRDLHLLYTIGGEVPDDEETLFHLEGWNGVGPVSIGNAASAQAQSDIYGEFLGALHDFLNAVDFDPPQKTNDHLPEILVNLVEDALALRGKPDQGIWEMRTEPQVVVHSQAMIWVAVTCAAAIGRRIGHPDPARLSRWEQIGRELRAEYLERGWNEQRQAYTMAYGSDWLDASILRLVLFKAIEPNDPRLIRTLEAIECELAEGDLIYRYRMPDGLEGREATFAACAFWRVGVLAMAGGTEAAGAAFERLIAHGNDLGLFAEEIDAATGEQRGNFPQAFTQVALISQALLLEQAEQDRAARA